jgi:integrase
MAKPSTPLTDTKIKTSKAKEKLYKLFDGGGLFLEVTPSGGKHWKLKYRFNGKEKKISLGSYPSVGLSDARTLRDENKKLIADGVDPSQKKQEDKELQNKQEAHNINTFKKLAIQRLDKVKDSISESHYKRTLRGFDNDCFKYIGDKPIDEVSADDIIEILQRMEKRGVHDSARKLYHSIGKTFKWAVSNRYAKRNPANDIDIGELLGKQQVTNYATFTDDANIRGLLLAIDSYQGEYTTKQALKMISYTAVRTINIRYAEWCEIDFNLKQWNIPAHKMKTKNDLIIPLAPPVIKILEDMRDFSGDCKYIFRSVKSRTAPMSDNTLLGAIRRLGFTKEEFTPHGFRAMFSSIAHEKSPFKYEAIELHLAHSVGNGVSKAYNRAKYLDERRELMQWWADYLDGLRG